jgi:hypothetical protein
MKAYTLDLSGDEHARLLYTIEAAIFAAQAEINEQLHQEPWANYGWSVDDLLANPTAKNGNRNSAPPLPLPRPCGNRFDWFGPATNSRKCYAYSSSRKTPN